MMTDTLTVAIAQTADTPESHAQALDMLRRDSALAEGADLMVMPELALCGYGDGDRIRRLAISPVSAVMDEIRSLARARRMGFILGYAEREGETLYNAAIAIGPDGAILGNYRKVNLWGPHERGLFTPGLPSPVFCTGPAVAGLLICYDLEFAEAARNLTLRGADLLVVISATSRPYGVVPEVLVPARGYENGCHVAYANRCGTDGPYSFVGSSRITAPDGTVLVSAPVEGPAVVRAGLSARTVREWRAGHDYLGDRRADLYRLD